MRWAHLAVVAFALAASLQPADRGVAARSASEIVITRAGFLPNSITVDARAPIRFRNDDDRPHRVDFGTIGRSTGLIRPGATDALTIDIVGSYPFRLRDRDAWGGVVVQAPPARVTIAAEPAIAVFGATVRLRGTTSSRQAGLQVVLQERQGGASQPFRDSLRTATTQGGLWRATMQASAPSDYRVAWNRTTSRTLQVLVRARVRLARRADGRYVVTASAGQPLAGKPVRIEARSPTGWRRVDSAGLGANGRRVLALRLPANVRLLRAIVPGKALGEGYRDGRSNVVRVA